MQGLEWGPPVGAAWRGVARVALGIVRASIATPFAFKDFLRGKKFDAEGPFSTA